MPEMPTGVLSLKGQLHLNESRVREQITQWSMFSLLPKVHPQWIHLHRPHQATHLLLTVQYYHWEMQRLRGGVRALPGQLRAKGLYSFPQVYL